MALKPDDKGVDSLTRQIKMTGRAYPLFHIAQMILQKPERHSVTFSVRKKPDGQPPPHIDTQSLGVVGRTVIRRLMTEWPRFPETLAAFKRELQSAGMDGRGQDTFGMQKPDPEILRRTIRAAGGEIRQAVMVGDSGIDIATARAAGVSIVAVDFGYSETPIKDLGADRLIGHFDELAGAVLELAPAVR